MVATVDAFVALATERPQCGKPELCDVAVMRFDVMDDGCDGDAAMDG
jgi:hypothetical protein